MPNTKITREKLKIHWHYSRMIYVAAVILAVMVGSLVFTMTEYQAPNERRVDVVLVGVYGDTSSQACQDLKAALLEDGQAFERMSDGEKGVDVTAEGYEPMLQTVDFMVVAYDEEGTSEETYYAAQKYMVTLAAQEGDIYIVSRNQMANLIDQNALVPLDGYIDRGIINPGERDLARVTFDEVDDEGHGTGERHVYGLQAGPLTKLSDTVSYYPEEKYMVILQFSKNPDTAAAVMQSLIERMEPTEEEKAAVEQAAETAEAAEDAAEQAEETAETVEDAADAEAAE